MESSEPALTSSFTLSARAFGSAAMANLPLLSICTGTDRIVATEVTPGAFCTASATVTGICELPPVFST